MSDLLLLQCVNTGWKHWTEATRQINQGYADRYHADLRIFVDDTPKIVRHPSWNRVPQILDALDHDYRKIVYLDADTVIVNPNHDIWTETSDEAPWQMVHIPGHPYQWATVYNDGVWVVNNNDAARTGLQWVWDHRDDGYLPHHDPNLWSLAWELDYLNAVPTVIEPLDPHYNWHPAWTGLKDWEGGWINGYHGMPHTERWGTFSQAVERVLVG